MCISLTCASQQIMHTLMCLCISRVHFTGQTPRPPPKDQPPPSQSPLSSWKLTHSRALHVQCTSPPLAYHSTPEQSIKSNRRQGAHRLWTHSWRGRECQSHSQTGVSSLKRTHHLPVARATTFVRQKRAPPKPSWLSCWYPSCTSHSSRSEQPFRTGFTLSLEQPSLTRQQSAFASIEQASITYWKPCLACHSFRGQSYQQIARRESTVKVSFF